MASVEENQQIAVVVENSDAPENDSSVRPVDDISTPSSTPIPVTSADPSVAELLQAPNVVSDNESSQEINPEELNIDANPKPDSLATVIDDSDSSDNNNNAMEAEYPTTEVPPPDSLDHFTSEIPPMDEQVPYFEPEPTPSDPQEQATSLGELGLANAILDDHIATASSAATQESLQSDSATSEPVQENNTAATPMNQDTNDDAASEASSEYDSDSDEYEDDSEEEEEEDSEAENNVRTAQFDWERNITKPYFASLPFQKDLAQAKFPVVRNDEGAIVCLGDEWDSFLYCGRRLGRTAIPQSDGRCGPNNGPQCASCRRLQTHEKYKILEIIFPSLDRNILTAALRKRGGNAFSACQYLESSCEDLARVPAEVAFPGSRPDGLPEPCYPVSDADAQHVVSFFDDNILLATAKMALRKNEHNLEQAVTYILDKSPEQLAVETSQDVELARAYEDAVLAFQVKRREKMQEVATKLQNDNVLPEGLRRELAAMVPELDLNKVIPSAFEDGHGMVRPSDDSNVKCTVCALEIGTKYTGSHYCPQCNHCEGCIQTKVVYKCPRMGNGGHLHCCPLSQMKIGPERKGYICDIDGPGCLHSENHNLSYYCQECNFDVCAVCISKPSPAFYHRRLGRLMQLDEDEDSDVMISDSEEEEEEEEEVEETSEDELQEEGSVAEPATHERAGVINSTGPEVDEGGPIGEGESPNDNAPAAPSEMDSAGGQTPTPANEANSTEADISPSPESSSTPTERSNHPDSTEASVSANLTPPVQAQDTQEARNLPASNNQVPADVDTTPPVQAQDTQETGDEPTTEEQSPAAGALSPAEPESTDSPPVQWNDEVTLLTTVETEAGATNVEGAASNATGQAEAAQVTSNNDEATHSPPTQGESQVANEGENGTPPQSQTCITCPDCSHQLMNPEADEDGDYVCEECGAIAVEGGQEDDIPVPVPAFDLHERIAASRWGANEPEEDNQVEVIIGSGDVRAMERRLKRKQSSDSDEVPIMRHNRPETLLTAKYASALEGYICKECPAASNIHHVESLLHLAQGNEKTCPSDAICQAVGAGKMGIAATCLLAPIYGSKKKRSAEMKCFCGDVIDSKTAPDGAVGCLNGHALHPSCAADYLLSGGNCPTCREPLFFPKVGKAEASAAEEYLEAELQRRRKEEEEDIRKEQLAGKQVFNVNDIVRISSDVALCKRELMASPGKTGWASEMDSFCGSIGRITEVEDGKIKIMNKELPHTYFMPKTVILCNECSGQVGTKEGETIADESNKGVCMFCGHCFSCCSKENVPTCSKSAIKLNWTPSAVSLIGRASSAALWDKSLVDKDLATAAAAEQHIIRLRAEMNAVTTARATVQEALGNMKGAPGIKALDGLKEAVSAFDFERARHLLGLMNHWGDGPAMLKEKKAVMETLRKGDIDTAARKIRHHNASLVEEDAKWRYAASDRHEYVVESWAKIDLVAWPSLSAPRTGYCLGPKVRFQSKQEVLGADGYIWLLADENSLILPQFVNGKPVYADPKDPYAYKNLVGCQVLPGPKWNNDSVPKTEIGTITAVSGTSVRVKFSKSDCHSWHYPSEENGPVNLLFANPPAPQGWLCMTPRQVPVVRRGRDALQCFSCGDGLVSEEKGTHENIRIVQKEEEIKVGQTLLVAATLEPVEVKSVDKEFVHCSFATQDAVHSICVKFRRDDLLHPCSVAENVGETVTIDGRERSRQDLFMTHGNIADAKAAWNAAKSSSSGKPSETDLLTTDYASCVKGHLLHARCFQEALVAGKKCPVPWCNEPLWAPKVRRLQRDDDACCGGNSEVNGEAAAEANVSGMDAVARARNDNEDVDYHQDRELKMCPACFSGPLLNQNCNDMEAHHGQCVHHAFGNDDEDPCYFCADAKAISSSLMQLSGDKKVVDVLPRCPTHDCVIMFSGCMVCGHLFNETSWADLPKFDPCAKALLDVDRKKRKAAAALVSEITREAALLEYERDAVHNLWTSHKEEEMELPPLPPPAMGFSDGISESDSDSDEESDY